MDHLIIHVRPKTVKVTNGDRTLWVTNYEKLRKELVQYVQDCKIIKNRVCRVSINSLFSGNKMLAVEYREYLSWLFPEDYITIKDLWKAGA